MNIIETPQSNPEEAASVPIGESPPTGEVSKAEVQPPARQRPRLPIALAAAAVIAIGILLYWKRQSLQQTTHYLPVLLPSLIAAGQILFKDWNNYKPKAVRWLLLLFVLAACIWGISYQDQQIREKAEAAARVDAAQTAQQNNTTQFLAHLGTLSDKLNDLQTKIATEPLREELASVKGELEKTQKALDPPKARLLFSFAPFKAVKLHDGSDTGEPVTETTLAPAADGSLHVEFTVLNVTDVDALDGEMTLQICDTCKFAKEPAELKTLPGQDDRQRDKTFDRILYKVALYTLSADIIAPPGSRDVAIGMYFRCKTCVRDLGPSRAMIHVTPVR